MIQLLSVVSGLLAFPVAIMWAPLDTFVTISILAAGMATLGQHLTEHLTHTQPLLGTFGGLSDTTWLSIDRVAAATVVIATGRYYTLVTRRLVLLLASSLMLLAVCDGDVLSTSPALYSLTHSAWHVGAFAFLKGVATECQHSLELCQHTAQGVRRKEGVHHQVASDG